jgi:hypothetical protein
MGKSIHELVIQCKNGKSLVTPGTIHVHAGDSLQIRTVNTDITLFMPYRNILESSASHNVRLRTIHSDQSKMLNIREDCSPGTYTYGVFCMKSRDFAEGGSSPRMIVEE